MTSGELRKLAFDLETMGQATGNVAIEEKGKKKVVFEELERALDEAAEAVRVAARKQEMVECEAWR